MFYFLQKLPVTPLKNQIKFLWPAATDILLKVSSTILEDGMQMSWHCQISWLLNK